MCNNTFERYYTQYTQQFTAYTTQKLVSAHNREVDFRSTRISRQALLIALREAFDKRNIDYSEIGTQRYICYKYVVYLKNNKLYRLETLSLAEVLIIFDNYLTYMHPDRLLWNHRILTYDNDFIHFTVSGQEGIFKLEANSLIKSFIPY